MNEYEICFFAGMITCMLCDAVLSICNFFIQKSLHLRAERKYFNSERKKQNHENQSH